MSLSSQDIYEIRNSSFRAVDFIQTFFPAPLKSGIDKSKKVILSPSQIDAIDSIQYGFPLRKYSFEEVKTPPRGVVMVWPRQTGKSWSCAYAAAGFSIIEKNCGIGIISATDLQSKKLMNKIKKVLKNSIFWEYVVKTTIRKDFIEFTNGNFIECWPCTDGIEGSTYTYMFADEAALMDEEILLKSALPCVTHGKRWIMLSTPKGSKGVFINRYFKGLKSRPIICKNCRLEIPQAGFDVDDFPADDSKMPLEDMHNCPKCGHKDYKFGIGTFAVPFVDPWNDGIRSKKQIKALLDEHDWSPAAKQEYLGKVITGGSNVFLNEWIIQCTEESLKNLRKRKNGLTYVIGADYGKKVDASSFYVTHIEHGKTILDFAMSLAGEFDYEKEYSHIRADLLKLIVYYNPAWVVPDATGIGDPLVEELEKDLKDLRSGRAVIIKDLNGKKTVIKVNESIRTKIYHNKDERNYNVSDPKKASKGFIISKSTKPGLIGNLIRMFRRNEILIPPKTEPEIDKLREELLRFESEWQPGTNYIKYGTQSFHDDRVIALALSCWGHRRKAWTVDNLKITGGSYNSAMGGDFGFKNSQGWIL